MLYIYIYYLLIIKIISNKFHIYRPPRNLPSYLRDNAELFCKSCARASRSSPDREHG